jgi:acyl-CoA synthetase (AMP-forming)/AMP-acid ligase II
MNEAPYQVSPPLAEFLRHAAATPERIALVSGEDKWSYEALARQSSRLASGLAAQGVTLGERVALHMENTPEAVLSYLACLRTGAVIVPLNTRFAAPELRDLVARTRPAVYLGQRDLYERFASMSQDLLPASACFLGGGPDCGAAREWESLLAYGDESAEAQPDPHAPALLLSTSGTTGRSRIVVWSHRTLGALRLSAAGRGIREGAVVLLMTPMMHASGAYCLLSSSTQGATVVLVRRFEAASVMDEMERNGVTTVFALPFMWGELVREQRASPRDLHLRVAMVGGDRCPATIEKEFDNVFGMPLRSCWAATEEVGATVLCSVAGPYIRLIPQAHAKVVDANGVPVAPGEVGELVIRSPTTSPGYWVSATELTPLPDGSFASGDLVRAVEPGLLEYAGRKKDLIVRGGSNVSPAEVEEVLREHPDIADAAVAGFPDAELGERVGAVVVPKTATPAGKEERAIREWMGRRIAAYKAPERIVFVDAVPRNALTKIDRAAVRAVLTS